MPRYKALFSLLPMIAMAFAGSSWTTSARGDAPTSAERCTGFRPEVADVRIEELQAIGFETRFPLENWNGKYYQSGCGGYCGSVQADKPGFSNSIVMQQCDAADGIEDGLIRQPRACSVDLVSSEKIARINTACPMKPKRIVMQSRLRMRLRFRHTPVRKAGVENCTKPCRG